MIKTIFAAIGSLTLLAAIWIGVGMEPTEEELTEISSTEMKQLEQSLAEANTKAIAEPPQQTTSEPNANIASNQNLSTKNLVSDKAATTMEDKEEEPKLSEAPVRQTEVTVTEVLSNDTLKAEAAASPQKSAEIDKDEPTEEQLRNAQQRLAETINQMEQALSSL